MRIAKVIALVLLCAGFLAAQTNRGAITGTVLDQSGAVIPKATVIVTDLGTGQQFKLTTSEAGSYSVPSLDPVLYSVTVEAPGFKKYVVSDVKVDTASVATVNVTLQPGAVSAEVTVSAEATRVNTESGTMSSTVGERQIQDIPLVNRSVLDLAMTQPGVSGDAGTENPSIVTVTTCPGCNLSLNGGRPLSTLMLADGANNTGVSLARTMVSFSPEVVQEFTVQTSAFSAEYSFTGGGVINVTTKSGSNELNGTALWYNRNPRFSAAPYTLAAANRPVATLKYNQFSLAAGGPVYIPKVYHGKNKTFWFAAIEPFYRRDRLDQYTLVPTDAMRQGDFSGMVNTPSGWLPQSVVQQYQSIAPTAVTAADSTIYNGYSVVNGNQFQPITLASGQSYQPFPGNIIPPSLLDTSAQKALQYIVAPSTYFLNSNGNISNLFSPRVLQQDEKRYTARIDQMISDKNRLSGRFTATPIIKLQYTPVSMTTSAAEYSWAKQIMLADTHTFTPTLVNDLRLNYTRGRFSNTVAPEYDASTGANLNTILGLPNITKGGVPLISGLFPGSSLGGGSSTAGGLGSGGSTSVEDREERYDITDIVYKTAGKMNFKFGVDLSHSLQNVTPLYGAFGGAYSFSNIQTDSNGASSGTGGSPFASFMLGVPNGNVTLRSVMIPYYYRWNSYAAFVQDDWKVKPNLTLNLGIRWNCEMPRAEKYNNQGVFRPDLAQSFPLATPLTLTDGEVISSVLVPAFVFAGRGGNSKYLTPTDYKDFEPRFGFAWSPKFLEAHRVTLRGGYGLSHVPVTGSFRLPQPDFSATANFATVGSATASSSTANPTYMMRLGENPPLLIAQTPAQAISAPANGVVALNSLYYQSSVGGWAVSQNYHTPYIQNWNLTVSWQANPTTTVEIAYSGLKGTHLFMPHENINPKDVPLLNAQTAANINTVGTINDPLGRINPATGKVLTVQNGSLGSPYLGFSSLYMMFDASANSIRHGASISLVHAVAQGLTFSSNYTYAKSIDDASSSGGDKNVLTPVNGYVDGQVSLGGTRGNDRSVSTFDQRHVFNNTFIYDLPFGQGRKLLNHAWKPLQFIAGGWTTSGVLRINSGFPIMVTMSDTNLLGDLTHTARPDLAPGVPLINPLWSRSCPVGGTCQPYLNPQAFMRPVLGQLGTAPRTFDGARGPWDLFFDGSVQKTFKIGEGKRSIQFRVDALNAFNHPTFRVYPNNQGGTDMFSGAPSTAALTASSYNSWATANGQPQAKTSGDAGNQLLSQINAMVNAQKTPAGALPLDFYHVPLPANFWGTVANSFDIRTLAGYKLYQLRTVFNSGTAGFGQLYNAGQPRYMQFGVKIFF